MQGWPTMERYVPPRQVTKKFNRKDTEPHPHLSRLRNRGWTRARELVDTNFKGYDFPNKFYRLRSQAYSELDFVARDRKLGTLVDAGCGDSPDAVIGKLDGYKRTFGIDLFPQTFGKHVYGDTRAKFIQGDICEKWPFKAGEVDGIISNAVLDLMSDEDRLLFYKEAHRVLSIGGVMAVSIVNLKCGHGIDGLRERDKATMPAWGIGFEQVGGSATSVFVLRKVKK